MTTLTSVTFGGAEYSLETLGNLSGPELVKLHNNCATLVAQEPTRRFKDKSSALKRTWAVLQACGAHTDAVEVTNFLVGPDNEIAPASAEAEPTEVEAEAPTKVKTTKEKSMSATAAKKKSASKTRVAPARGYAEDQKIKVLARENPRRGEAAKRFELYKSGMTVGEYIKKIGSRAEALVHLRWDVNKGNISVH